jgi:hypothetical protein
MAHFLKQPDAGSTGYDIDNYLAPGSVWRMQVLVGGSRKIELRLRAALRVRSNDDRVVPNSDVVIEERPAEDLRLITVTGGILGTSLLEVGIGGDELKKEPILSVLATLQVQVTEVTAEMLRAIMPDVQRSK